MMIEHTEDPSDEELIESIVQLVSDCYESKKVQTIEFELGGPELGDSIVITATYKGNKNANLSIN